MKIISQIVLKENSIPILTVINWQKIDKKINKKTTTYYQGGMK
jgi:hypothetical protein